MRPAIPNPSTRQEFDTNAPSIHDPAIDALRRDCPETWSAIVEKASKQRLVFPFGMNDAAEPAYCFVPQPDRGR